MKFQRNLTSKASVPTASMGDIVFLLLIFFMVTTVFKTEDGLPVELPRAESGLELKRDRIANIYVDRAGRISVNDKIVEPEAVGPLMRQKIEQNPLIVVSFESDTRAKYRVMDELMEELKDSAVFNVAFKNKNESAQAKY